MVLVVQNHQEKILSELTCASSEAAGTGRVAAARHEVSGRNPLSAALLAVAQAVGGLAGGHMGHRGMATSPSVRAALGGASGSGSGSKSGLESGPSDGSMAPRTDHSLMQTSTESGPGSGTGSGPSGTVLHDWSSYLGESPVFEAGALSSPYTARFSSLDIEMMHRGRLMRSVGLSRAVGQVITDGTVGELSLKVDEGLERLNLLINQVRHPLSSVLLSSSLLASLSTPLATTSSSPSLSTFDKTDR